MNGAIVMFLLVDFLAVSMLLYFHYDDKKQRHTIGM